MSEGLLERDVFKRFLKYKGRVCSSSLALIEQPWPEQRVGCTLSKVIGLFFCML